MRNVPGFWFEPPQIVELRRALQRPRSEDGFWAWYFGRRVSIYVTLLLSRTSLTPNMVTVLGIAMGVTGGVLWSAGAHWSYLVGSLLLEMFLVMDCVDGELARMKNLRSPVGAYLDYLGHYLMDYCMILGLGIGLARTFGPTVMYVAMAVVVIHLGDELLRDVLLKARVSSGKFEGLDRVHRTFSLFHSFGPVARTVGSSVVGAPSLYSGVLFLSLVDLAVGGHLGKLIYFLLWGSVNLLRFAFRFRRILRTAFREEMVASS